MSGHRLIRMLTHTQTPMVVQVARTLLAVHRLDRLGSPLMPGKPREGEEAIRTNFHHSLHSRPPQRIRIQGVALVGHRHYWRIQGVALVGRHHCWSPRYLQCDGFRISAPHPVPDHGDDSAMIKRHTHTHTHTHKYTHKYTHTHTSHTLCTSYYIYCISYQSHSRITVTDDRMHTEQSNGSAMLN
jgi:hypothetical protein